MSVLILDIHDAALYLNRVRGYMFKDLGTEFKSPQKVIFRPVAELKAIRYIVEQCVLELLSYRDVVDADPNYMLTLLFKEEYESEIRFVTIMSEIHNQILSHVYDFVGNDTWAIYTYSLKGSDLIITKGPDYRVQIWERLFGAQLIDLTGNLIKQQENENE